jgi:hypothetical protein
MRKIIILLIACFLFFSCDELKDSTDKKQRKKTEVMLAEADRTVGMPGITNFTEKRFVKMLYELRDKEVTTYSYYLDFNGKKHFLCKSVGFGIPASVQFVSPEKIGRWSDSPNLPQAEPNGLFMPDSLSATYVMCVNPKTKKIQPVYFEPQLIVSPFKLK